MTDQPYGIPWRGQHRVPSPMATTAEFPRVATPARRWWGRLDPAPRALLIISAVVLPLFLCCGGLAAIGVLSGDPPDEAGPDPAAAATASASAEPSPTAVVAKRTVTETEEIPFQEVVVEDPDLAEGTRTVRTEGTVGAKAITYEVTVTDGVQTGKRKLRERVTREPVDRVIVVGTKQPEPPPAAAPPPPPPEKPCHPSYTGACVPIASDVDCAGGSGDGPAYVRGPVYVGADDPYDLDRDGDGVACE